MEKQKIWIYIIEILVIVGACIYLGITKVLPEYQESVGSSEKLFNMNDFQTAVEVKIPTGPEFFILLDKKDKVMSILVENEESSPIINKNIEGKKIQEAINDIFQILIDNQKINNKNIVLINYGEDTIYHQIVELIKNILLENNMSSQVIEESSTWKQKAQELGINEDKEDEIIWSLYLQSADIIDNMDSTITTNTDATIISKDQAIEYADSIYAKLTTYMINANVENQEKNALNMPIQYIPADNNNTIYASSDSWYYIQDYKVYAEITLASSNYRYTFCYNGSNEDRKEGICS